MKILFLCSYNSSYSPIAEGLAKQIFGTNAEIFSASLKPENAVHPLAFLVMKEVNIDISTYIPKAIEKINIGKIDVIVALNEESNTHQLTKSLYYSWDVMDPSSPYLAASEQLEMFGHIRDSLKKNIIKLERSLFSGGH